ncbi:hypothetical protein Q6346_00875 [Isoptericola sp. b490]|uniref:hypothetical protein n=1 Tax=Actinotalea lenta TaxID=3064654 RepID=UPI002712A6B8|nr:hypothetical protein [Isoptericola sp. b490]MDO8119861.1 hypothetical protein [Isoptericola sp. b490]
MHPDLYLVVYRQMERELEQRLAHQLAARTRAAASAVTPHRREPVRAARQGLPRATAVACCPA